MAKLSLAELKALVVYKWKPLVAEVRNWMDSFRHKDDAIAISEVTNLQNIINTLSAGINGLSPYKRVVADYTVDASDYVIAVGYDPATESPSLSPNTHISLLRPVQHLEKEVLLKRYCQANTGNIIITPLSGLIQNPITGVFESNYYLPAWGEPGSVQKWKSDGTNYQAI